MGTACGRVVLVPMLSGGRWVGHGLGQRKSGVGTGQAVGPNSPSRAPVFGRRRAVRTCNVLERDGTGDRHGDHASAGRWVRLASSCGASDVHAVS